MKKKKVRCFDLKQDLNGDVVMEYKGRNFTKNEFCILIDPESDEPRGHQAEICEKEEMSFAR